MSNNFCRLGIRVSFASSALPFCETVAALRGGDEEICEFALEFDKCVAHSDKL